MSEIYKGELKYEVTRFSQSKSQIIENHLYHEMITKLSRCSGDLEGDIQVNIQLRALPFRWLCW